MPFSTLISVEELHEHLEDPLWAVVDCRFSLKEPQQGRLAYRDAHIPGAVYAHLDEDLSGAVIPGVTGRHPLPPVDRLAETFSSWGIASGVQVVAYDDVGGDFAARLWWLLRWLGHEEAAVLDGGWRRWGESGRHTHGGVETRQRRHFRPHPRQELITSTTELLSLLGSPQHTLVDVRTSERYRGEMEPIDPVAGHIPGALNLPYPNNLAPDGRFLAPFELRQHYRKALGETPARQVTFYCGSGVTAAHNVLAMAHAGLGLARLYPGSWSEWITDPARPVAKKGSD